MELLTLIATAATTAVTEPVQATNVLNSGLLAAIIGLITTITGVGAKVGHTLWKEWKEIRAAEIKEAQEIRANEIAQAREIRLLELQQNKEIVERFEDLVEKVSTVLAENSSIKAQMISVIRHTQDAVRGTQIQLEGIHKGVHVSAAQASSMALMERRRREADSEKPSKGG